MKLIKAVLIFALINCVFLWNTDEERFIVSYKGKERMERFNYALNDDILVKLYNEYFGKNVIMTKKFLDQITEEIEFENGDIKNNLTIGEEFKSSKIFGVRI
jgi:hypothetical protein